MPDFSWIQAEDELSAAALTVRAQTISPNDDGMLVWDAFLPRRNVDSTEIRELTSLDLRVVGDRREWNARGRLIHLEHPDQRLIEMVPIESYFTIEEKEIQKLMERTLGNQDTFREVIGARIPARTDSLIQANYRRVELDAMEAWAKGQITTRGPQTGRTFLVSFGFDAGRYQTAGTAWDDGGVNAYDEFLSWLEDAIDEVGPIQGAMMRLATLKAIQADAPNPMPGASTDLTVTRAQLQERVSDELGIPFRFYVMENSLDVYDDGGRNYTRTKVWPAQIVAAVPQGEIVGSTAFAPVARAMELARQAPGAGIDVRGQTVYHDAGNGGRELTVEAQVNAMPIPDEQRMWVIDAGV